MQVILMSPAIEYVLGLGCVAHFCYRIQLNFLQPTHKPNSKIIIEFILCNRFRLRLGKSPIEYPNVHECGPEMNSHWRQAKI